MKSISACNRTQPKPNTDLCVQSVVPRNTSSSLTIPFLRVEEATTRHALIGSSASCDSIKADTHIACRAHAASMPFPCHAVPLRV